MGGDSQGVGEYMSRIAAREFVNDLVGDVAGDRLRNPAVHRDMDVWGDKVVEDAGWGQMRGPG